MPTTQQIILNEQNFLTSSRGSLDIKSLPEASFTLTSFNVPGISTSAPKQTTPFIDIPTSGDTLVYESLTMEFTILSDLSNWIAIHDWLVANTFPDSFDDRRKVKDEYSDATLMIYSAHNNPICAFEYRNLTPTSLSEIRFNTTDSDVVLITASATFDYQDYRIKKLN